MAYTGIHILDRDPTVTFDVEGKNAYLHIKDDAVDPTVTLTISVAGAYDRDLFADPIVLAEQLEAAAAGLRAHKQRHVDVLAGHPLNAHQPFIAALTD